MSRLIRLGNWLFVLFFYLVCIVALKNMISESFLAAIFLLPVLCAFQYFYRKYKDADISYRMKKILRKYRVPIWCGLQVLSIILMVIMTAGLRVNFTWDWGKLISTSVTRVLTGEWRGMEYYSRYPNNQVWLLCLTAYFKFVQLIIPTATEGTFYAAANLMSIIFTQITIFLVYQTARILFNEIQAFCVGVTGLLCLPFYLYAQFAYNDTVSMMIVILLTYMFLNMKEGKGNRMLSGALLIILSALIFHIKILCFIVVIAMILDSIWNSTDYRKLILGLIICFVLGGAGIKITAVVIENKLPVTDELADQFEFPWTHWVMMGMNNYGGYLQEDVDFSIGAGNYEEKEKAEIEELKRRIMNYGPRGTLKHLFYTKLARTWGNSCLAGDDYSHRKPYNENSIWQRMFGAGEDLHWIVLPYTWFFHILMIFGMFFEGVYSLMDEANSRKYIMLRYTLIGVGIFLTIWECNSRYLLPFLPVMILLSARGWETALYKISEKTVINIT